MNTIVHRVDDYIMEEWPFISTYDNMLCGDIKLGELCAYDDSYITCEKCLDIMKSKKTGET